MRESDIACALAEFGKLVERILNCRPLVGNGFPYPVLGPGNCFENSPTLGDVLFADQRDGWNIARLQGDILGQSATLWTLAGDAEPAPRFKVRIACVLRRRDDALAGIRKAGLTGDDLDKLLEAFCGLKGE